MTMIYGSTRFMIFHFWNGRLSWISHARTERGVQAIKRNAMKYDMPHNRVVVKVISIEEILNWEQRGIDELEALFKESR
jgi:tRNA A37 threonylcarbamoyladenosine synthetase subunit TsaC/SUA5/YrdC